VRGPSLRSLALLAGLSLVAAGCASSAPLAQSEGSDVAAGGERRRTASPGAEPALKEGPGAGAEDRQPEPLPEGPKLAADPYQRTPRGERGPEPRPLAPFRAPKSLRTGQRPLRLPASLGVALVREGRCAPAGEALLQLEAALAKDRSFREVLGLAPPRGAEVGWPELGRLARRAGHDLLLVVLVETRQALLVHTQGERREPVLLAGLRAAPQPEEAALVAPTALALELELVIQSLAKAHSGLRLRRAESPSSMRE